MKLNKTKGTLIIKEIPFEKYLKKKVISNNKSSGKITLPKYLIGKEVYIVLVDEND